MKQGRRAFLQAAGIAPAAAAVTGLAATGVLAAPAPGEMRRSHFSALAGERFEVELGVFEKVGAKLASVTPLPRAADGERSFRLLFEAEPGKHIAQGSWRVTHPAIGTRVMFLSPNDAEGRVAEAVFNRL